ncbi:MAG TPA: hypothetical protein VFH33_01390, partial [Candidatus Krumholzibacteria bacterium]|nr:hypothetical protein [Candidatus Krumholzibacteria bacterium]
QTLALADNIDAPANMLLGRELTTRLGSLDDSAMENATRKVMGRLNPNFRNFKAPVKSLSGGQRQSVAIARAVHFNRCGGSGVPAGRRGFHAPVTLRSPIRTRASSWLRSNCVRSRS